MQGQRNSIQKRFASQVEYTTGPKAGEQTKRIPQDTIAEEGVQPGSGSKISGSEFNHVINYLLQEARDAFVSRVDSFRPVNANDTDFSWHVGAGRHPSNGQILVFADDTSGNFNGLYGIAPDGSSINFINSWAGPGISHFSHAFVQTPNTGDKGPGLYVTTCDSTDVRWFMLVGGKADNNWDTISNDTIWSANDAGAFVSGCYDSFNDVVIFLNVFGSVNCDWVSIPDGVASPTATTGNFAITAGAAHDEVQVCCDDAGNAVAAFRDITNDEFRTYHSSDGGLTWTQKANFNFSTDGDDRHLCDCGFYPDGLHITRTAGTGDDTTYEGPCHVFLTHTTTNGAIAVFVTQDNGATWQYHDFGDMVQGSSIAAGNKSVTAALLGEYVVRQHANHAGNSGAITLTSMKNFGSFAVNTGGSVGPDRLWTDEEGTRIFCGSGVDGEPMFMTGAITAPRGWQGPFTASGYLTPLDRD